MKLCLSTSSISSHWQLQFKNFFCIFSLDLATKSGKTLPVSIEYYLPVNIGFCGEPSANNREIMRSVNFFTLFYLDFLFLQK